MSPISTSPRLEKNDDIRIARISKNAYNKFVDKAIKSFFCDAFGAKHGLDHYKTFTFKEKSILISAKDNGTIIGALKLRISRTTANIGAFVVVKDKRGSGIGSKLIEESIEIAKARGCEKVWLFTMPALAAYKFYKKHGFTEEARLKRHFGGRDMCIMSRFI